MPFQPAPNTARLVLDFIQDGQHVENVLHFWHNPEGGPLGDVIGLVNAVSTWVAAFYLPAISEDVMAFNVTGQILDAPGEPKYASSLAGLVGGQAQPADPNNVTLAVHFSSTGPSRSGAGRAFVIGIPQNEIAANTISPEFLTAMLTVWYDALQAAMPEGWQHAVLSRVQGGVTLAEALAYPVTSVSFVDNIVDSQRRRLPGRGR